MAVRVNSKWRFLAILLMFSLIEMAIENKWQTTSVELETAHIFLWDRRLLEGGGGREEGRRLQWGDGRHRLRY